MNPGLNDIEAYFNGQLSAVEKIAFEKNCVTDPVFAEEVAVYIAMRTALKQRYYQQKTAEFAALYQKLSDFKLSALGKSAQSLENILPNFNVSRLITNGAANRLKVLNDLTDYQGYPTLHLCSGRAHLKRTCGLSCRCYNFLF